MQLDINSRYYPTVLVTLLESLNYLPLNSEDFPIPHRKNVLLNILILELCFIVRLLPLQRLEVKNFEKMFVLYCLDSANIAMHRMTSFFVLLFCTLFYYWQLLSHMKKVMATFKERNIINYKE